MGISPTTWLGVAIFLFGWQYKMWLTLANFMFGWYKEKWLDC
jgi:hypothetical protein